MRKRRLMLLGMAFLSVIMFSPSAAAQSSTVVSADSNLTRTNITVEFTGLQASQTYDLEYLDSAGGTPVIRSFTTSGTGAASVEFRHAPFTREQSSLAVGDSKGWIYQLTYAGNDTQAYAFEVLHGNMLSSLDTMDDNNIGSYWSSAFPASNCQTQTFTETDSMIVQETSSSGTSCMISSSFDESTTQGEALLVDFFWDRGSVSTDWDIETGIYIIPSDVSADNPDNVETLGRYLLPQNSQLNTTLSAYKDPDTRNIVLEDKETDEELISVSTSVTDFKLMFVTGTDQFTTQSNEMHFNSISNVPYVSKNAWILPNRFNPAESDLIFNEVVLAGSDVGLEYSADGESWSSTPPSGLNDNLFYRNTGGGTLQLTATDTGQAFQSLDVTPISPQDNAVYPIPTNESLPLDFEYDVFYGEEVESSVTWTLSNSTEELSRTIYPDLDAPIDRSFTESATVPIGEYNWTVSVSDSSLGASSSETFSFSVIDEANATVSFDLISPSSGAEVSATDGVDFTYEVQAENSGTLNLWIPELSQTSPQFTETLGSGTTSRTVNLDVPSGSDLSWYLTFEEDSTGNVYTSQSVQFTTAAEGTEPTDPDDEGFSIPSLWFSALESLGFDGDSAGYLTAFIVIVIGAAIGFVLAGTFGGAAALALTLLITAVTGLLPSWIVLVVVFLAAGVTAYFIVEAVTGGN